MTDAVDVTGAARVTDAIEPARYLRDWHLARDHPADSADLYAAPEVRA